MNSPIFKSIATFNPSTLKGRQDMRKKVEMYLEQERLSYIGMNEINQDFCRGFLRFLEKAKNSVAKKQIDAVFGGKATEM